MNLSREAKIIVGLIVSVSILMIDLLGKILLQFPTWLQVVFIVNDATFLPLCLFLLFYVTLKSFYATIGNVKKLRKMGIPANVHAPNAEQLKELIHNMNKDEIEQIREEFNRQDRSV